MTQKPDTQNPASPIAIIGMGCLFPKSTSLKAFWHLLYRGINAVDHIPDSHWSIDDYYDQNPNRGDRVYCQKGGFLPSIDFDPTEFGIPPNILEATDTSQLLGLVVAKAALENAGYGQDKPFDRDRTSVIIGVTGTQELVIPLGARLGFPLWRRAMQQQGLSETQIDEIVARIAEQYVTWQENSFPGLLGNVVAGRISNRLDLHGTNCVVDAACASSMSAIHMAAMELASGRSEMVITGGIDTLNDVFMHMCFSKTKTLSSSGDAKPFSGDADGTVLGEGLGLMVLKRLDQAQRDGDRIYALIRAIGSSSDGRSQSIYAPRKSGQIKAISKAYQQARIDPGSVTLLEAHGTGTRKGDAVEVEALRTYFGEHRPNGNFCALGSVKSNIGHTKAAAGAAGLIKTALALYHKVLPPTLKAQSPDPQLKIEESPFYISQSARPWVSTTGEPRRAGVSAFGFGGSNFHVVLEEYPQTIAPVAWEGDLVLAAFSAADAKTLRSDLQSWARAQADIDWPGLGHAAYLTCRDFDSQAPLRLVWVIDQTLAPHTLSDHLDKTLTANGLDHAWQVGGLCFSNQAPNPKTAFVFPGQGSQYPHMARDLFCLFPQALGILQTAEGLTSDGQILSELLYPKDPQAVVTTPGDPRSIHFTANAQPAIGVVSAAMSAILSYFDIAPDMAGGHSFGELSALHAAGTLDTQAFLKLALVRGHSMAQAGNQTRDPGTMLAVRGPIEEIAAHVSDHHPDLVVANRNAPLQVVVAGPRKAIEEFKSDIRQFPWKSVPLPVSAAFHSSLVADAQKPFAAAVAGETFALPTIPVYGNTEAAPYPTDAVEIKKWISRQLAHPVNFQDMIEKMYADGARLFVEVGPKQVLSGLIGQVLAERPHTCLAVDGSGPAANGLRSLAQLLAQMAVHGRPVALDKWENFSSPTPSKRMRVKLSGANYRNPESRDPVRHTTPLPSFSKVETPVTPAAQPVVTQGAAVKPDAPLQEKPTPATPEAIPPGQALPTGQQVSQALAAVSQGLQSMQALQEQTAQAHQRFLEVQAEAGRALQQMIHSTRWLTGETPAPAPSVEPSVANLAQQTSEPTPFTGTHQPVVETPRPNPTQETGAGDTQPGREVASSTALPSEPRETGQEILSLLRDIVSDLTGYPKETLTADQNLESDLGIDSIKRVEIFSTLEDRLPDLPRLAPEDLARLQTLEEIARILQANDKPQAASKATQAPTGSTPGALSLYPLLAEIVAELTGYPQATLAADQDLESDLGIDSIKRVEIFSTLESRQPGLPKTSPEELAGLKTLGQIAAHFEAIPASSEPPGGHTELLEAADQGESPLTETLLSIVSDLTGYPAETLQLDQDLESDLGIDSIKRVEIFSALESEMPGLPKMLPEQVATLKTLSQVLAFFGNQTPSMPTSGTPAHDKLPPAAATLARPNIDRRRIVLQTRPAVSPNLPPSSLCKHMQTVYLTDDGQGLARNLCAVLDEAGISHRLIGPDQVQGIIDGQEPLEDMAGMILLAPVTDGETRPRLSDDILFLKQAFQLSRLAAPMLMTGDNGQPPFLATVTRLDGAFGFHGKSLQQPVSGGLAGLVKTAAIEWPQTRCRAYDVAPQSDDLQTIARYILSDLLAAHDPAKTSRAPIEVGLQQANGHLEVINLSLTASPLSNAEPLEADLQPGDVFVLTGGGRGITADVAVALAARIPATWVLLGRSPDPQPEPAWLAGITDEGEMKRAILTNLFNANGVSPKELEKAYRRYAADRQIRATLDQLVQVGATGHYLCVDVRDAASMRQALQHIVKTVGPIRGLIHAAGTLADRLIIDKSDAQFDQVFDTKVQGLFNLLDTIDPKQLRYALFFSSVTARFGNQGQADYAMANEVLNKVARDLADTHPHLKVCAFNWGPWDGGMVTPSLKQAFAQRGVDLIPRQEGAAAVYWEMLSSPESPVEVVWGASLKTSPQASPTNADATAAETDEPLFLSFKHQLDLNDWPILKDHTLEGKPVVPLALISEFIGHGVLLNNPGLHLFGFDNLRLLKGIILDEEHKRLRLMAGKPQRKDDGITVAVELRNGFKGGRDVIHSRATALLNTSPPQAPRFTSPLLDDQRPYERPMAQVYDEILFHGTRLHGIREIHHLCEKGIVAKVSTAPAPQNWLSKPLQAKWLQDPLAIDCAFQMAIVWAYEQKHKVCLPTFYASYRQYRSEFPPSSVTTVYEVHQCSDHKVIGEITFLDDTRQVVAQVKGYEAVFKSGGF